MCIRDREWTRQTVAEELPEHAQIDWKGESREYQEAGGAVLLTVAPVSYTHLDVYKRQAI